MDDPSSVTMSTNPSREQRGKYRDRNIKTIPRISSENKHSQVIYKQPKILPEQNRRSKYPTSGNRLKLQLILTKLTQNEVFPRLLKCGRSSVWGCEEVTESHDPKLHNFKTNV